MSGMTHPTRPPRAAAAISVACVAALGLFGAAALNDSAVAGNGAAIDCGSAKSVAERMEPLAKGEVAAVQVGTVPAGLPELSFTGPDGARLTLADFKGRAVLLNLWATWCVPCRKEMPALDALQTKLGGADFEVVAINMDTRDPAKPKAWLRDNGITHLAYHADPESKVFQALRAADKATGLPTTLLIDRNSCLLAHIDGPAEWASDEALALVRAAIAR